VSDDADGLEPRLLRPAAGWELVGILRTAASEGQRINIDGGATKADVGRLQPVNVRLSTTNLRGIIDYDAASQVVSVQCGTPIHTLERELLRYGMMLGFEPPDLGPLFGRESWQGTAGGAVASNYAGSRRLVAGTVADNLVGAKLITGTGRSVEVAHGAKARIGAAVLRVLAGSWGQFGCLTEVSLKVTPLPDETASLVLCDLPPRLAIAAMADAIRLGCGLTGAVYLDAHLAGRLWSDRLNTRGQSITLLRFEGRPRDLPHRLSRAREALAPYGSVEVLPDFDSTAIWSEWQILTPFQSLSLPLWRMSVPRSQASRIVETLKRQFDVRIAIDWAGELVWLETTAEPEAVISDVRRALATYGGHATLVRASEPSRARVDCFNPIDEFQETVLRDLKRAFDPHGIINPGRVYVEV